MYSTLHNETHIQNFSTLLDQYKIYEIIFDAEHYDLRIRREVAKVFNFYVTQDKLDDSKINILLRSMKYGDEVKSALMDLILRFASKMSIESKQKL